MKKANLLYLVALATACNIWAADPQQATKSQELINILEKELSGSYLHDKVTRLLDEGADVNVQTEEHRLTPLVLAVMLGNKKLARLLLERGADVNNQDNALKATPLHYVASFHTSSPGGASFFEDNTDMAKLLLDWGVNKTLKDKHGQTAAQMNRQLAKVIEDHTPTSTGEFTKPARP
ncbi:MAG: ankyrin repeat domain-containing protein [Candidatus Dependentiae bacterium]